jgi:hypothetical protein
MTQPMNTYRLTYSQVAATVADVIEDIVTSPEWEQNSETIGAMEFMDARELFRRFFDAYEGSECEEWLGIMEWAVIEELPALASHSTIKPAIVDAIVSRMKHRPNVSLSC